jgi:hypothetical protein
MYCFKVIKGSPLESLNIILSFLLIPKPLACTTGPPAISCLLILFLIIELINYSILLDCTASPKGTLKSPSFNEHANNKSKLCLCDDSNSLCKISDKCLLKFDLPSSV